MELLLSRLSMRSQSKSILSPLNSPQAKDLQSLRTGRTSCYTFGKLHKKPSKKRLRSSLGGRRPSAQPAVPKEESVQQLLLQIEALQEENKVLRRVERSKELLQSQLLISSGNYSLLLQQRVPEHRIKHRIKHHVKCHATASTSCHGLCRARPAVRLR